MIIDKNFNSTGVFSFFFYSKLEELKTVNVCLWLVMLTVRFNRYSTVCAAKRHSVTDWRFFNQLQTLLDLNFFLFFF